jgi:uncharacterized protein
MRHLAYILAAVLLVASTVSAQETSQAPVRLTRWVTDQTGTLSDAEVRSLESRLRSIEEANSNQIVVVIIPGLNGGSLEETSLAIAERNGVGKKAKNNGVLLLVVKDERQIRIEVGYGLEGALPDITAGKIIRNEIVPRFREGDYFGGISAGVDAIDRATRNEYTADPKKKDRDGGGGFPFILIIVILFIILNGLRRRRFGIFPMMFPGSFGGRSSGGGFGGGMFGGGGFSGGGGGFGGGGASGRW